MQLTRAFAVRMDESKQEFKDQESKQSIKKDQLYESEL